MLNVQYSGGRNGIVHLNVVVMITVTSTTPGVVIGNGVVPQAGGGFL